MLTRPTPQFSAPNRRMVQQVLQFHYHLHWPLLLTLRWMEVKTNQQMLPPVKWQKQELVALQLCQRHRWWKIRKMLDCRRLMPTRKRLMQERKAWKDYNDGKWNYCISYWITLFLCICMMDRWGNTNRSCVGTKYIDSFLLYVIVFLSCILVIKNL